MRPRLAARFTLGAWHIETKLITKHKQLCANGLGRNAKASRLFDTFHVLRYTRKLKDYLRHQTKRQRRSRKSGSATLAGVRGERSPDKCPCTCKPGDISSCNTAGTGNLPPRARPRLHVLCNMPLAAQTMSVDGVHLHCSSAPTGVKSSGQSSSRNASRTGLVGSGCTRAGVLLPEDDGEERRERGERSGDDGQDRMAP